MPQSDDRSLMQAQLQDSSQVKLSLVDKLPTVLEIVDELQACASRGGTIYSCGNGGSACDAIHLTEELVARYLLERPGIRAQHFCDAAAMTCWSNDYSFDGVFERHVNTFVTERDVFIALSTSGKSENIVRALKAAQALKAKTILLSGRDGGQAKDYADIPLIVDSNVTARIQEAHVALVHIICDRLETRLFG